LTILWEFDIDSEKKFYSKGILYADYRDAGSKCAYVWP